jgi:carbamoyltransferase
MTRVLGLVFSGHGTSACLVEDGRVVRAVNLERITRRKFSLVSLPSYRGFLQHVTTAGFGVDEKQEYLDFFEIFPDLLEYVAGSRTVAAADLDLVVKVPDNIHPIAGQQNAEYRRFLDLFTGTRTCFDLEHHICHGYQAFLSSPFESAAVLTIDGTGERLERLGGESVTASLAVGEGTTVRGLDEIITPFSVGGMYSTFTRYLGFRNEQEGNTMALAAFGDEEFWELVRDVPMLGEGGVFSLRLNLEERTHEWYRRMRAYCPPREPGEPIEQRHKNLAYGVQRMAEECVLHAARGLAARTGHRRLALAGGVALNCVANWKILTETPIETLYVMPNAGDRGLAAGAALYGYHVILGNTDRHPPEHDYLGKIYGPDAIRSAARTASGIRFRESTDIAGDVATLLAAGRIVGWCQGGAEFGPRALGHRSILADPRTLASKERLDLEIKRREWFRPYAPSVLAEHAAEYFEMQGPSPYMLQAVQTRRDRIQDVPGIVHVDGTARVQTIDPAIEPRYHRLVSAFQKLTGTPMVLNTSFNGYGEPIVETPGDGLSALKGMGLDALAFGDLLVWPEDRPLPAAEPGSAS